MIDKAVSFELPEGFELLEQVENSLLYTDGTGFIEVKAQEYEGELGDELIDLLSADIESKPETTVIDCAVDESGGYDSVVFLYESGENEDSCVNWTKYLFVDGEMIEMKYSLSIDAEEEEYFNVSGVLDSLEVIDD